MKAVAVKLISVAPVVIVIAIIAYIIEELVEDFYSEALSDFVYPIAGLMILVVIWRKVIPSVKAYLEEDKAKSSRD